MKIQVRLFAGVKQLMQADAISLELPENAAIADVRRALIDQAKDGRELLARCMFAIDSDFASDETVVSPEQEIACIPPVSGG